MTKTALVTGITGQDGSYLAELLLGMDYKVVGMVSKKYNIGEENIEHFKDKLVLEDGDLLDSSSIKRIFTRHKPNHVYNLAGISFLPACWKNPVLAFDINALGPLRILEIIRDNFPKTRLYQASSAKIFGQASMPQNEQTVISPIDPYGISKAAAHFMVAAFRRLGIYAVSGVLYNHESPRRGPEFVTRKITIGAAKIKLGQAKKLKLGNLQARADWGWAPDYVRAMYLMLSGQKPQDFVIATGELHSVEDVCQAAFGYLKLDYRKYVISDKMLVRRVEAKQLVGDSTKARQVLGWKPSVSFRQMIETMVDNDLKILQK